jgi:hypothetical protein
MCVPIFSPPPPPTTTSTTPTTGGIHEFADSQFGHLFAKGATREDARKALILALKVRAYLFVMWDD